MRVRPKAVVVFSAHWQAQGDGVNVNVGEGGGLIYEWAIFCFQTFPSVPCYDWKQSDRYVIGLTEHIYIAFTDFQGSTTKKNTPTSEAKQ